MPKHLLLLLGLAVFAWGERIPGRYIVELDGDTAPVSVQRMRNSVRLARVRAGQEAVRKRLGTRSRVLSRTENLSSSLTVEMPDEEAAALAQLPGVKRVYPARVIKLHMDRAVTLTKVLEAWPKVGGEERAGEGMKIAIIDSGVDVEHPGLAPQSLTMPATFPRANRTEDEAYTSAKVIVARSYVDLLRRDPDLTPRDRVGHGTALAMIAAGRRVTAPLATITGVAPQAQIGSYKVFGSPLFNDASSDDVIIKAIDDAVADGMDVINLSLGSDLAPRVEDDPLAQAVERATRAGAIVVVSSGNNGSEFGTVGSPGTAPSAITVGATRNGRIFAANAQPEGWDPLIAVPGNGRNPTEPLTAPAADIRALDPSGLGCNPARAESLRGRVALILRGTCTFEEKINNALVGGAVAVLVYATAAEPAPFVMAVGSAGLPALMVSNSDGERLRQRLATGETVNVTLRFTLSPVDVENRMSNFSSIGPGVDALVKPEIVAVGGGVYTATQKLDQNGDMFNQDGYIVINGTSFSAPMVAGAAAVLKAARPGLTVEQYRSLLINTAVPVSGANSQPALVQQSGAGQLDLAAAVSAPLAVSPAILHFGVGGADPRQKLTLQLSNLSGTAQSYSWEVLPSGNSHRPLTPSSPVTAAAGATVSVDLPWEGTGLATGAHEGRVRIQSPDGTAIDVPYWYSATSTEPALFPFLAQTPSGRRGGTVRDVIQFRVTDAAGVPIPTAQPEVIVREGGGTAELVNGNASSPGLWRVHVRLGLTAGANVFRIQAGEKFRDFTVVAQ